MSDSGLRVALALTLVTLLCACERYDAALLEGLGDETPPPASKCGNARLDEDELCDIAIPAGMPDACPQECPTVDACELRTLAGYKCQTQCVGLVITTAMNGDECCPEGVGAGEDSDCGYCGDEVIGPAEVCDPPETCDTIDSCPQSNSCIFGAFVGDAESCTAHCNYVLDQRCENADGCCPAGCNSQNDDDCSASCGNGVVEPLAGESCEQASEITPCPESCDDGTPCTNDITTGSLENCNLECTNIEIQEPINGDGCCPTGAHSLNDSDCQPRCGNQVREVDEGCDPCGADCDDRDPCTTDQQSGSPNDCSMVCTNTPLTAPSSGDACCPSGAHSLNDSDCAPVCGNQVSEDGEECDGGAFCDANCALAPHNSIIHRYGFNGNLLDSVGSKHGTLRGSGATLGSTSLTLTGGTSGPYVELPADMIRGLSNMTLEIWVRWTTTSTQRQRIFECGGKSGSEGTDFFFLGPRTSSDKLAAYMNFTDAVNDTAKDRIVADSGPLPSSGTVQLAATFDGSQLKLYRDGQARGTPATAASGEDLRDIGNVGPAYCYIGHSLFDNPPEFGGIIYEMRVYDQALSAQDIATSANMGPDP
jgi:hypothetical protein